MKILKINSDNPEKEIIDKVVEAIKKGKVIIYPTDTVYGLGVNALDEKAVKKIFQIKGRDFNKPISIIVKDIEMAKKVASFGKDIEKILEKIFPGPVTVILFKKKILSEILTGGTEKIGLRIPDCKFTRILMENLDFPITTTSANISGSPVSTDIQEILNQFENQKIKPDLIIDAGILSESQPAFAKATAGKPSTVLDLTGLEPEILRVGPVSKEEFLKVLKRF